MQLNDLSARLTSYQEVIQKAIDRVLNSGWLVLGEEVKRFEKSFAEYIGSDHCVSVANGTDAIELGLKALNIQRDDRVATVANAGMYTTNALLAIGAIPYFMDVDLDSKNVTLSEVKRALGNNVACVVVTHLYGLAVSEILAISEACHDAGIPLFEDCAQAHGARIQGRLVGSFGDASGFSFYPTKNLGALGDAGAVVSQSQTVANRLRELRQYGWSSKYEVSVEGGRNSRMDEMQAAILNELLPFLDHGNSRRRAIAARYNANISNPAIHKPMIGDEEYVAHLYVIRCSAREQLRNHLRSKNIGTDVHYPIPDYRQPLVKNRFTQDILPNTAKLATEVLSLPCYPELSDQDVDEVIAVINGWS